MSEKSKRLFTLLLVILIILTLAFIWGNSLLDRQESTKLSVGLLDRLMPFLRFLGIEPEDDHFLRKLAHFCEFGLLGLELALLSLLRKGRYIKAFTSSALFALVVAVTDESIQLFTGRACQVSDMLLDFSGSLCALAGIWIISSVLQKNNIKKDDVV